MCCGAKPMPRAKPDTAKPGALTAKVYGLKLREGHLERMQQISYKTGVPIPEQVRRALEQWLTQQEAGR
jgi:hypothetical protein